TGIYVSISSGKEERGGRPPFTPSQESVIKDVLVEASRLLGSDAADLPLPPAAAARLGLPAGATYRAAHPPLSPPRRPAPGRDLTGLVLCLRRDRRVQGEELP